MPFQVLVFYPLLIHLAEPVMEVGGRIQVACDQDFEKLWEMVIT